jgi:hypothetical protein
VDALDHEEDDRIRDGQSRGEPHLIASRRETPHSTKEATKPRQSDTSGAKRHPPCDHTHGGFGGHLVRVRRLRCQGTPVRDSSGLRHQRAPRDRKGRFIETGTLVKIWGGKTGTVLPNVGGGRIEIKLRDGTLTRVHRNCLAVQKRADGTQPTADRSAEPAAFQVEKASPDAQDFTPATPDARIPVYQLRRGQVAIVHGAPDDGGEVRPYIGAVQSARRYRAGPGRAWVSGPAAALPSPPHTATRWPSTPRTRPDFGEGLTLAQVDQHRQCLLTGVEPPPGRPNRLPYRRITPAT